ncbi:unnamed protein product [Parnassius apollo]|uniref:(apollo) hypothetical protein n=1 Tax=Parnassius apollo TaxID=110799 RepID=A0A8S3X7N7_PARAO|nr:unnamed protein product [Parnassius apollo]
MKHNVKETHNVKYKQTARKTTQKARESDDGTGAVYNNYTYSECANTQHYTSTLPSCGRFTYASSARVYTQRDNNALSPIAAGRLRAGGAGNGGGGGGRAGGGRSPPRTMSPPRRTGVHKATLHIRSKKLAKINIAASENLTGKPNSLKNKPRK